MSDKIAADNRKAYHDFFLFDRFEAGIELKGSEVKSIRDGHANIKDAYIRMVEGEVFVVNLHIAPYKYTHHFVPEATRTRKLLLKHQEIEKLYAQMSQKGFFCVALKLYFKRGYVKIEIALAKKKKAYDKRADIKKRIEKREIDQTIKAHRNR